MSDELEIHSKILTQIKEAGSFFIPWTMIISTPASAMREFEAVLMREAAAQDMTVVMTEDMTGCTYVWAKHGS